MASKKDKLLYDLVIIGGGPAGCFAAERAAEAGLATILFEKKTLGGSCIGEGLFPTMAMMDAAKSLESVRRGAFAGTDRADTRMDYALMTKLRDKEVKLVQDRIIDSFARHKIKAVKEKAEIIGREKGYFLIDAAGTTCRAERILLATGAEAVLPRIFGLPEAFEKGTAMTHESLPLLKALPERLAVIGSGPSALEVAYYFLALGSQVTVVDVAGEIGGTLDKGVAAELREGLERRGMRFCLDTTPTLVNEDGIRTRSEDGESFVFADKVLISMGKAPSASGFGIEKLGIQTEFGAVVTDAQMRTNVAGVWAAGDVNGKLMAEHTAVREARAAISDMTGVKDLVRYESIPQIIRTAPEAAWVGETEITAGVKGLSVEVKRIAVQHPSMHKPGFESEGVYQLLLEKGSGRLLGAHLTGSHATEVILTAAFMIGSAWKMDTLLRFAYPHPTESETLRDALYGVES
ncbi:MAG: NAD(P)/FAD-dependent oxidoreductase [Clostridiales Family XIII bacterium]|nr:NAD(P)/FAD-dependent oxidoreductase [Clostridiales Family XIII bacterium]